MWSLIASNHRNWSAVSVCPSRAFSAQPLPITLLHLIGNRDQGPAGADCALHDRDQVDQRAAAPPLHLLGFNQLVKAPQPVCGVVQPHRRVAQGIPQLLDVAVAKARSIGAAVQNPQRFDAVPVVFQKPCEVLQLGVGSLDSRSVVAGTQQLVEGGLVDDLVEALGDLSDRPAQPRSG